jgi:hypothetical protein
VKKYLEEEAEDLNFLLIFDKELQFRHHDTSYVLAPHNHDPH